MTYGSYSSCHISHFQTEKCHKIAKDKFDETSAGLSIPIFGQQAALIKATKATVAFSIADIVFS